jgi:hypothetical protein
MFAIVKMNQGTGQLKICASVYQALTVRAMFILYLWTAKKLKKQEGNELL